jgi:chromosomal replication initiator protein
MNGHKIIIEVPVIINIVADYLKRKSGEVICTKRKREFIKAKHIAMYCCREFTNLSYREIGEFFNNKDHATVLNACKSVHNQYDIYKDYRNEVNEIIEKLKSDKEDEFKKYRHYETENV